MRSIIFIFVSILFAHVARAQLDSLVTASPKIKQTKKLYQFRAYSLNVSLSPYTSIAPASSSIMGLFDIEFDDRVLALDLLDNGAMEEHIGIGFLPYQGTEVHVGGDIEILPQAHRVNLFGGIQYTVGLPQSSSPDDNSSIYLGWHHYFEPYIGIDYWPGKLDQIESPRFRQLFYARLQVGYSFLLSRLVVDSTGNFDPQLYQTVRRNTGNTLAVKICVGIDIPSLGGKLRRYKQHLSEQYHLAY